MDPAAVLLTVVLVALLLFAMISIFGRPKKACDQVCPRLREASRRLWKDHGDLTREFARRYLANDPSASGYLDALMKNQEEIGDFIEQELAPGSGRRITALLKEHIAGAGEILADISHGHDYSQSVDRWRANGAQVADRLSRALGLPKRDLQDMMTKHLDTTLTMVSQHVAKHHVAEKDAVDAVMHHLEAMADAMVSKARCMCPLS